MKETTEEYIARLKAGLATLETALYEAKMSAQEVNTRKNKQIAEQQAEIEAMRSRFTLAFWHDTFVEVKKPNSDLIYRFKLDETNDS